MKGLLAVALAFSAVLTVTNICPGSTIPGAVVCWGLNDSNQADPCDGNDFTAIAAGYHHSLALKSDGSIVGWGENSCGQAVPPEGNDFIAIAAGEWHSLALKSNGSIVGWGFNAVEQAAPPEGNDFVAIAAGSLHSLALKKDGTIVGWGANQYGQAGPFEGNDFVAIAAGNDHSLALKAEGNIVGWGYNWYGQAYSPPGKHFVAVAAGYNYSLALKSDGSIFAWGADNYGQSSPPAGKNFVAVAAGFNHSLALKSDGSIIAWGTGQPGMSGYYNYGQASPPAGHSFVAVAAGQGHSIAIKHDRKPKISVEKCSVTAGDGYNKDSISISGTMHAEAYDFCDVNSIEVAVSSMYRADDPFTETFLNDANSFKKGRYKSSSTADKSKSSFVFDTKTSKFSFSAKNVDLTGLSCPLILQITNGDFNSTAKLDETIVNGPKKPIPLNLLMGATDSLKVTQLKIKRGPKYNTDRMTVKGIFTFKNADMDMTRVNLVAWLCSETEQGFAIPAGRFKPGNNSFSCPAFLSTNKCKIAANFNFKTCTFTLTVTKTRIYLGPGPASFILGIDDNFVEASDVVLN